MHWFGILGVKQLRKFKRQSAWLWGHSGKSHLCANLLAYIHTHIYLGKCPPCCRFVIVCVLSRWTWIALLCYKPSHFNCALMNKHTYIRIRAKHTFKYARYDYCMYVCASVERFGVAISKLYNNNSNSNKCTNSANWNSSIQRYPAVCRNRFLSRTPLDSASLGRQQLLNVAWRIVTWRCKCAACTARLLCFARLGLVIGLVCVLLPAS